MQSKKMTKNNSDAKLKKRKSLLCRQCSSSSTSKVLDYCIKKALGLNTIVSNKMGWLLQRAADFGELVNRAGVGWGMLLG